ncbi:ATP synthase F1, epsilon subunit [Chthoniobacter flavus Ellin428]|uniref:ATP synthase epsilon chain n=1 Tax=Chthoniobacter flavus Ellin428 TaxID=497964 RepID=B4D6E7_9BACT|nr:ATP synthase F1 subunit epsilon [Chthoniobacter flavus]EDY18056.1 ATP synthase F1, epsilon subunit [Chthoniobacter flavus Ellin428]TCO88297.1 F-type H+-transporting ATPase subunit epsilon [Chthoniobacter flavus]
MATLRLEIVTPDKLAFEGDVESVVIPGSEGELGVLPMHIPLMTQIKPGEVVITQNGKKDYLAVGEGFATVTQTNVNILTDMAIEWQHIDETAAEAAIERAKSTLAGRHDLSEEEVASVQASLLKSLAQLHVRRRHHS